MISVIIPTLDRPDLLNEALRSVASQTFRRFEVIVVNDGGGSVEHIVAKWRPNYRIVLIELERQFGAARARNVGVNEAQGELLAFLDDDDIFLPRHLARASELLKTPSADLVYTGAAVSDRWLDALPDNWAATMHTKAYDFDEGFLQVANFIHTGSVVARNFADSAVRFDEQLGVCEDWDLWIALRAKLCYRVRFVDEVTSIHHRVPGVRGLIANAQRASPTPLAVAREYIHAKWPTSDRRILAYRGWFMAFEATRNDWIRQGKRVPRHVFDSVLIHLYERFKRGEDVDRRTVADFFDE